MILNPEKTINESPTVDKAFIFIGKFKPQRR